MKAMLEFMNARFEAQDKRFETLQQSMDKRFEAIDKRFEDTQKYMDKRFEDINKRFTLMMWFLGILFSLSTAIIKFL